MQTPTFRILVVDDDIDLLMLMERKLRQNGYKVESAVSLAEAEYISSIYKPHLVLLDINLAGEDGRQLCWKLKNKNDSTAKVILMSGTCYPINRILLFGADDFIAKPFPAEFVEQKIKTILYEEELTPLLLPQDI